MECGHTADYTIGITGNGRDKTCKPARVADAGIDHDAHLYVRLERSMSISYLKDFGSCCSGIAFLNI